MSGACGSPDEHSRFPTSGANLTNDSRSLVIRHSLESARKRGSRGECVAPAALDARFLGHDEEVSLWVASVRGVPLGRDVAFGIVRHSTVACALGTAIN